MRHILILAAALGLMGCNGSIESAAFVEGVDGLRCSAHVLRVSDTGEAIDGDPVAELTLLVAAPAAHPFETTIDATVPGCRARATHFPSPATRPIPARPNSSCRRRAAAPRFPLSVKLEMSYVRSVRRPPH